MKLNSSTNVEDLGSSPNIANAMLGAVPSVVYNEDCVEGLKRFADKHFDLAIVDPPYGIGAGSVNFQSGTRKKPSKFHKVNDWDNAIPTAEYWEQLFRVSKNQIVWGGNYYDLPRTNGWIIWKKMDISNDFNPIEMAWTSNLKMGFFDFLWAGMWQENMKDKEKRIHPTQKPKQLYKWVLQRYAKEGDLILDTHVGSGSSRIACNELHFDFTGFEIDKDYYEAQEKRFKDFVSQLRMF